MLCICIFSVHFPISETLTQLIIFILWNSLYEIGIFASVCTRHLINQNPLRGLCLFWLCSSGDLKEMHDVITTFYFFLFKLSFFTSVFYVYPRFLSFHNCHCQNFSICSLKALYNVSYTYQFSSPCLSHAYLHPVFSTHRNYPTKFQLGFPDLNLHYLVQHLPVVACFPTHLRQALYSCYPSSFASEQF